MPVIGVTRLKIAKAPDRRAARAGLVTTIRIQPVRFTVDYRRRRRRAGGNEFAARAVWRRGVVDGREVALCAT
jgi:hypothetical protein